MPRSIASLLLLASLFLLPNGAVATPYSGLVVEPETKRVLYERRADELRHPASLTKMMTLYLVFEALDKGELFEDTVFRASRFAVLRPPSKLGLHAGDTLTVEEGILSLVTRSANDAATVIAEGMAGSESAFAALMTQKARELGMASTVFRNASGLPDSSQVTTAWDMYYLGRALQANFPQYYPYFSTSKFYFDGKSFGNHNHLLETYPGTDGIKTGFINSSGFNLVASAVRNGRRLVGVVFGGPSAVRRDQHMRDILDDGFAQLAGYPPSIDTADFDRPDSPKLLVSPGVERPQRNVQAEPRPKKTTTAKQTQKAQPKSHTTGSTHKKKEAATATHSHGKAVASKRPASKGKSKAKKSGAADKKDAKTKKGKPSRRVTSQKHAAQPQKAKPPHRPARANNAAARRRPSKPKTQNAPKKTGTSSAKAKKWGKAKAPWNGRRALRKRTERAGEIAHGHGRFIPEARCAG